MEGSFQEQDFTWVEKMRARRVGEGVGWGVQRIEFCSLHAQYHKLETYNPLHFIFLRDIAF